jgi:hypothetical protein
MSQLVLDRTHRPLERQSTPRIAQALVEPFDKLVQLTHLGVRDPTLPYEVLVTEPTAA